MRMLKSLVLLGAMAIAPAAYAAGEEIHLPETRFSSDGIFGTFDRASVQRGFQVYREVCSNCHSMRLLSYRNLSEIGLTEEQIRAVAADVQVQDGPNDEGQMFERPGRPSDRFRRPFANDAAARTANNGALPPDFSVIAKAREGGPHYIQALLTGYEDPPAGFTLGDGMNYNRYFPGHQIAMAAPLNPDQVEYADHTPATVEQMSRDVALFLHWAAEPELEQRRQMGIKIVLFLGVLGVLAYGVKRRIWADLH
ncbi:cytochrome c1 [Plastoroseomonas arctica]|uniref:Cytochrome c1 n=1 Tax=Plastoroseomonas arctica TaxID=1509237 RepID=A0AAF1JYS5_9PROT|nr:cytochrome c1 [Plastoroseomonas arctica]MBR0657184.1 cytochrome c1 [Plastoroseomonas arctica]